MDSNERLHHEWLGMAQPEGLVVTVGALRAKKREDTTLELPLGAPGARTKDNAGH